MCEGKQLSEMYLKVLSLTFPYRKDVQETGGEGGNVAEATKEKGREELGPGWVLREGRLHFTSGSQNTDLMKDIGKDVLLWKYKSLISTKDCINK